jgi:uncharacterized protein with PhoU and TrkA domain
MTSTRTHWDTIYTTKNHNKVSWHQAQSTISLDWILDITNKNDAILDVASNIQQVQKLNFANHSYLSKVLLKL